MLNRDAVSKKFLYEVSALTGRASVISVNSLFENRRIQFNNRINRIDEDLAPYESKVYEIVLQ